MEFDFNGALFALSYALDCVEHDLLGVTTNHGKRVAAVSMMLGEQLGVLTGEEEKQALSACAIMHDSALTEYVQEEFGGSATDAAEVLPHNFGRHCIAGEQSMRLMPFPERLTGGAVLNHHENADGSGPFGRTAAETPAAAQLIHIADTVDAVWDLSWLDMAKRAEVAEYVRGGRGTLFCADGADAFLSLLGGGLAELRNEKIDVFLKKLLPGGMISCTPSELTDFASVFARIVDCKSHFTRTHSAGIAQKARTMAEFYGADQELAAEMFFAGALHDIGKLAVDRAVLEKPAKLTDREYRHIQTHAYYTFKVLSDIPGLGDVTKWAAHHHEKLDGTGYPFGLKGSELGKWERLMACLDIYQALTEERPYKRGMTHVEAVKILDGMAVAGKLDGQMIRDIDGVFGAQGAPQQ